RRMAARAERVALGQQRRRMRIVTVAARHAGPIHCALHERSVLEHLVEDLSVVVIEAAREPRWHDLIEQPRGGDQRLLDLRAPTMAERAGFDLVLTVADAREHRRMGFGSEAPRTRL